MIQTLRKPLLTIVIAAVAGLSGLLSGCGGGDNVAPSVASATLGGTAAVGFPIVGGAVTLKCAGGSNLTTTTDATGAWSVTPSGQTLPCAVQVANGTINGVANTSLYQSLATSFGVVNVSPLTDLLFANLFGSATPGTLFGTLTPTQIAAITPAQITTALTNLRAALQLTALNNINPITLAFNATPGVLTDDILSALRTAIANAGITYQSLLTSAG